MKRIMLFIVFSALLFLFSKAQAFAQNFYVDAEFRPRSEYRDGYQKPLSSSQDPAFIMINRTRLKVGFENDWINSAITLQDSRVFGQSEITSQNIGLNLYEGWVELKLIPDFTFTIGRQAIAYDYNRLFSTSNWTNTGKAHDLALLKYNNKDIKFRADLGFAYNNLSEVLHETLFNDDTKLYQSLGYLRLEKSFENGLKAGAIFVGEGFQNIQTDTLGVDYVDGHFGRYTTGANFELNNKEFPLSFTLTGYYQFGNSYSKTTYVDNLLVHKDLNAYFGAVKIDYNIINNLGIFVGMDYYSGTDEDAAEDNTWNKLYGSNHSFNGSMEYWKSVPTEGLVDYYGGLKYGFLKNKINAEVTYHFMTTQKDIQNEECSGKKLGSELDIKLKYKIVKNVALEGGWSTYFNSDNTNIIKGVETDLHFNQWAYLSLIINPQLFNTKNLKN